MDESRPGAARRSASAARPLAPVAPPMDGALRAAISQAIVRIHAEHYGKGATQAKTYVWDNVVVVVLRDVLTAAERTLVSVDRPDAVRQVRSVFQLSLEPTFRSTLERLTGRRVSRSCRRSIRSTARASRCSCWSRSTARLTTAPPPPESERLEGRPRRARPRARPAEWLGDQPLCVGQVLAAPHRQRGDEPAAGHVQDAEGAVLDAAAHDLALGRLGDADPFRRAPIRQVGPEVRHLCVRAPGAEHRGGRRAPLRTGDLVVLDPHATTCRTESNPHMSAAQTPRAEVSRSAEQATPPVSPSSSPRARQHDVGHHARAHHDHVGRDLPPRGAHDALDALLSLEPLDRLAADQLDAVVAQQAREELARRRAEVGGERGVLEHHHRAAAAERGQRRRDLAGDVGAADEQDPLGSRVGRIASALPSARR